MHLVAIIAVLALGGNHSGQWEIAWVPPCPRGFLCKLHTTIEPNYGQALKEERALIAMGDRIVALVPVP